MAETKTVTVLDREVAVKAFTDSQIMLMVSEAKTVTRKTADMNRRMDGVDRMMRLLDSVVVNEEDKEWIVEKNIAGELSMGDLIGFISAHAPVDEIVPRAVRRGRPRKQ